MNKRSYIPAAALAGGAAAMLLRFLQNRTGFEADTGLPVPGNLFAYLVPLALLALAAGLLALGLRLPGDGDREGQTFTGSFSAEGAATAMLLTAGCFLWTASGALEAFRAVPLLGAAGTGSLISASGTAAPIVSVVLGVLTALSGAALLPLVSACRNGAPAEQSARLGNLLLFPAACLVIRLVLTYRADSVNPALAAYYVELLAQAFLILGLYRASSFAFRCGRTPRFVVYDGMALVLCLTALADRRSLDAVLLYLGGASMALGLLTARMSALAGPRMNENS